MFNLSSPRDQVSYFIVNSAFLVKFKNNVQILIKNRNVMATKLSIGSITPSLKAVLT